MLVCTMYICQIYRKETKAKISSVKSYAMKLKGNSYRKMIYDLEKHRSIRFTISPKLSKRISGSECLYIALQDFCCINGFGERKATYLAGINTMKICKIT